MSVQKVPVVSIQCPFVVSGKENGQVVNGMPCEN